ncbi:hypothetical protein GEO36_28940 [Klebsiella pneumoniae]|nr:hypothetical protein [Klebsiella pneumoniae]
MSLARKLREKRSNPIHSANEDSSGGDSINQITSRQSMDLVIGFCGAVGSGIKSIVDVTEEELDDLGYDVYRIRVSELMQNFFQNGVMILLLRLIDIISCKILVMR